MPIIKKSPQGDYEVWEGDKLLKKFRGVYQANNFLKKLLEEKC